MRDPSTNPPKAMFQLSGFYYKGPEPAKKRRRKIPEVRKGFTRASKGGMQWGGLGLLCRIISPVEA